MIIQAMKYQLRMLRDWKAVMAFRDMSQHIHKLNETWWRDPATGNVIKRNMGEMLMLCVTELSEAMEGYRTNRKDDHLPHRPMFEVELADCMIRIFDICGAFGIDIGKVILEKLEYNSTRPDHKPENRIKPGGKIC